jgi:DNA-binding NarL/FixJ family response regulator
MPQEQKIRLLVADDHELVRCGLKGLLAGTKIDVVAGVPSGPAAVEYVLKHDVDIVLMDVRMPDGDGLNALGRIKLDKPDLPILMFSTVDNPSYAARAVAMGASGYLLKGCTRDELVDAITKAVAGENLFTRQQLRRMSGALAAPRFTADIEFPLTQREADVLRNLANGMANKDIAKTMNIGCETVKEHVQHIFRKIGLNDRTQAAVWAVRKGLV